MKSSKPKQNKSGNDETLHLVIGITVVVSIVCAGLTAYLLQACLDAFNSSHAMAGLITDSGVIFDDKNTEKQLSKATLAMIQTRDIATATAISSTLVLGALSWRVFKKS